MSRQEASAVQGGREAGDHWMNAGYGSIYPGVGVDLLDVRRADGGGCLREGGFRQRSLRWVGEPMRIRCRDGYDEQLRLRVVMRMDKAGEASPCGESVMGGLICES